MQFDFAPFDCFPKEVAHQTFRGMHFHDMHEFFLCLNSIGSQFVGARAIPNCRHSLFCFPAGVPHYCSGAPGKPAKGLIIFIPEDMFLPEAYGDRETHRTLQQVVAMARQGHFPIPLTRPSAKSVARCVEALVSEFTAKLPGHQAAVRSRLQELFVILLRDPVMASNAGPILKSDQHDERLLQLFRFINQHYMEKITVEQAANIVGMSRSHFHFMFRAKTDRTLMDFVTRVRVRAAFRLLQETDVPISRLALDCGFPTLSHFYEAFKNVHGKTPHSIRTGALRSA